jgi:hypothetical protein
MNLNLNFGLQVGFFWFVSFHYGSKGKCFMGFDGLVGYCYFLFKWSNLLRGMVYFYGQAYL